MTDREKGLAQLRKAVARIDQVLVPWGFRFDLGENDLSSPGGYACGFYRRGSTRIGLICRANYGLGCVEYEYETITDDGFVRESVRYGLDHTGYMQRVGHDRDCLLIEEELSAIARDGGDPVDALIHDLSEYAAPTLRQECPEFLAIIRSGYRRTKVL